MFENFSPTRKSEASFAISPGGVNISISFVLKFAPFSVWEIRIICNLY